VNFNDLAIAGGIALGATSLALILTAARRHLIHGLWALFEGLRHARVWQVVPALFFVMVLAYSLVNREAARDGLPLVLCFAGAAALFVLAWGRELLFLMTLRDEDLPGRFDKPIWAFLLIALAPLGLVLFRIHRLAHWPEPRRQPKPRPAADIARKLA